MESKVDTHCDWVFFESKITFIIIFCCRRLPTNINTCVSYYCVPEYRIQRVILRHAFSLFRSVACLLVVDLKAQGKRLRRFK